MLGYGTADVTVTEGASAVPQRVLTSLFGAGLLRDMGRGCGRTCTSVSATLFDAEALRFTAIVDGVGVPA